MKRENETGGERKGRHFKRMGGEREMDRENERGRE